MALNCGGKPPDEHNPATAPGFLLIQKGSDINMPMQAMEASTTIFGTHESVTGHQMKFTGGSSSSSYVRSGTSTHGDYIGTMSSYGSYASGGQTAESYYSELHDLGSGAAQLQLGSSDQHCRKETTHLQQYQQGGAPAPPSNYRPVAQGAQLQGSVTFDHYRHHQRLHPMPQQDQREKASSSSVFNTQMHVASLGDLHEHSGAYYKVGDHDIASGRTTRKVPHGKKLVETKGQQEDDEDEDEEDERAEVRTRHEEQSMHYELQAPLLIGVSSHGDLAGAVSMSTSSGGGDSMSMMMMKKRRLTNEQVSSLEVSFERESKLEPERKNELAVELGLQPRQVAVWFQNRRARSKTKQLERDFDNLKIQYDAVRSEKDKLQAQVARLKDLLDAQMASSKGNTPTTSSEKQGRDDGLSALHSSPQKQDVIVQSCMDGGVDRKTAGAVVNGVVAKHAEVFSTHHPDPTLVHAYVQLEVAQSPNKAPITLEVKPSLQVPHINHHRQSVYKEQQQQQDFSKTFSPPTKLSLCSPQKLFLHQMVSMRTEGESFCKPPYHDQPPHNLYNQEPYNLPRLNENDEEEYRTDSMICFDSAWHHAP